MNDDDFEEVRNDFCSNCNPSRQALANCNATVVTTSLDMGKYLAYYF